MGTTPRIGVMGCLPRMPDAFPIDMRENAGNMIHGNAPFEMFPDVVFYRDPMFTRDGVNFHDYVNRECSHVLITLANTIRLGNPDGTRYARFQSFLERCQVPIVIFGLGVQSPTRELPADALPTEAIELMKYLGDHTEKVGVRGEFTAAVFEHYAGVTNTFVTGCPSFFSRPSGFDDLAAALAENRTGRASFNGTKYGDPDEERMLIRAIQADAHWVESANPAAARYHRDLQRGSSRPRPPGFLKQAIRRRDLSREQVEAYFAARFRIFRTPDAWYQFNREQVGFTYGTRFHSNMASLLAGVPALWVTHDSRTEEFTDYLRVPALPKEEATELSPAELRLRADYAPMYAALPELFARFNQYLSTHSLPAIPPPAAATQIPETASLSEAQESGSSPSIVGRVKRVARRILSAGG
ncbi:MAG: polysaccharide pyruvyl transferase family protein [Micropruina sp.]|nr:polysaccharide pyruvyl transferase family protein [Micropruina sp.]